MNECVVDILVVDSFSTMDLRCLFIIPAVATMVQVVIYQAWLHAGLQLISGPTVGSPY
jgi:hypothetical protein